MYIDNRRTGLLKIYIGTPESDNWEDYLYLDLVVPGREINLYTSSSLDDCAGADFLQYLETAFNEARIFAKSLGARIQVEMEEILSLAEELDESEARNVRKLLKEME